MALKGSLDPTDVLATAMLPYMKSRLDFVKRFRYLSVSFMWALPWAFLRVWVPLREFDLPAMVLAFDKCF